MENLFFQSNVVILLQTAGFQYAFQLPQEIFEESIDFPEICKVEEYLGWEIQYEPSWAVIHVASGYCWLPTFEEMQDVERIKGLIRKGFEYDLQKALGAVA